MVLYCDSETVDGGDLYAYESLEELKKAEIQKAENCDPGDCYVSNVVEVTAGDAWIKTLGPIQEFWLEDIEEKYGEMQISKPGTHPGGNFIWIDPLTTIFGPVYTEIEEE